MSLAADIQRAVKAGVAALMGIAETVTYQVAGEPSYNPTTGAPTAPTTAVTVPDAIFLAYRREEIDGDVIRPEDQRCLIPTQGFAVTPTLNDQIVRGSETWTVVGIRQDPARAVWELQVRRP